MASSGMELDAASSNNWSPVQSSLMPVLLYRTYTLRTCELISMQGTARV